MGTETIEPSGNIHSIVPKGDGDERTKPGRESLEEEQLFNVQVIEKFMSLPEIDGVSNPYYGGIEEAPNLSGHDKDGYPYMVVPLATLDNHVLYSSDRSMYDSVYVLMTKEGSFLLEFCNRRYEPHVSHDDTIRIESILPNLNDTVQSLVSRLVNSDQVIIDNVSDSNDVLVDLDTYLKNNLKPGSEKYRENYLQHIGQSYIKAGRFALGKSPYSFPPSEPGREGFFETAGGHGGVQTGIEIIKEGIKHLSRRLEKKPPSERDEILNSI